MPNKFNPDKLDSTLLCQVTELLTLLDESTAQFKGDVFILDDRGEKRQLVIDFFDDDDAEAFHHYLDYVVHLND